MLYININSEGLSLESTFDQGGEGRKEANQADTKRGGQGIKKF